VRSPFRECAARTRTLTLAAKQGIRITPLRGGNFILVQFHDHPQAEYNIWLYKLGRIKTTYQALMALGDDLSLARGNPPPLH
jgi:hypothetical protein